MVWQVENIQLSTQNAIDTFASMRKVFVIGELGLTHSTLVVLASVENNQTVIECLGFVTAANPELSDPVTVTVFGEYMRYYFIVCYHAFTLTDFCGELSSKCEINFVV